VREHGNECLRSAFRRGIRFLCQDIRSVQPEGPFDLVLCRNVVFTYFGPSLQRNTLVDIAARMRPGAVLVVGKDEELPDTAGFEPSPAGLGVYWKDGAPLPIGA
jgi:chemotaxis protein methyltransferase CheR